MSAVLVLTTGQTDVQFVEGNSRRELSKDNCAALHDEIEQRVGEWTLVPSPLSKQQAAIAKLPSDEFELCTPKLDAVLRYLSESEIRLMGVLIFETRRDADEQRKDPRFAGTIFATRLRESGIGDVRQVPFLTGKEHLEDRSEPRDAIIRRAVVTRIDLAVRAFLDDLGATQVIVAATGGLPAVNLLIEEVVQLHAMPVRVELLEIADGAKANPPTEDRAVARHRVPEPSASYQARRQALELISNGNLLGAWGAVQHLHVNEDERWWTRVVAWLASFAASLPVDPECDIPILRENKINAVRASIRVELALRAGDIPRAVHGTVAFFECALWDKLKPHLIPHDRKHRLYRLNPAPNENLIRTAEKRPDDGTRPFVEKVDGSGRWYEVIDDDACGPKVAKYYLECTALYELGAAISGPVRRLRNDVAHTEPTPELMDDARKAMIDQCLWSSEGTFLAQPMIQNVLRDLGEPYPERLCSDLLSSVRLRLLGR